MKPLCIAGIGNPIMGDDGVGISVVKRVQAALINHNDVSFLFLYNDLFEIADHLSKALYFLFVDAVVGQTAGKILRFNTPSPPLSPSLHQTDILTVMQMLKGLDLIQPFPSWELWGVTIPLPLSLGEGLSQKVASTADQMAAELVIKIKRGDFTKRANGALPKGLGKK